jgi:hypothetical protein
MGKETRQWRVVLKIQQKAAARSGKAVSRADGNVDQIDHRLSKIADVGDRPW